MSTWRPVLPVFVLSIAIVAAAGPCRAASGWGELSPDARSAISRSIETDLAPQTIDSVLQEAKLGSTGNASFGEWVAMSGDTVVAAAPFASPAAVYVFVKPATGWADTTAAKSPAAWP